VLVFGDDATGVVVDALDARWLHEVRMLASMTGQGASVLTITGRGADKGRALQVACADLGIDPFEVVAIGDSETDIEMFTVAGGSVAMGQAKPAVRDAATWVTASNSDDGVGQAIEQLLASGAVRNLS
jgi:hydroxymethylpyrimidine pyrophosphatase-like HAD family hydrolase